ncbi:MAG: thiol-disulfide oxidoreductase [Rickettsiales bacterium]|nr:thiol-disulfide oxidoreductase [Rickettsiales bacterium]
MKITCNCMNKITVFFDGKCNLCSKEINYYKKRDLEKKFHWIDITLAKDKLKNYGISYNESLMFLHIINKKGQTQVGVQAFITIWSELKYWRVLAKIINLKPINVLTNFLYQYWAKKRFSKLKYKCDI